jgi:hypothetical protein
MKNALLGGFVAVAVAALAFGLEWPPKAKAVGPGFVENVNASCGTSPTAIAPASGKSPISIACECDAAVAWGGSSVDVSTDYSAKTFSGNVRRLYCDASSATACRCVALVGQ